MASTRLVVTMTLAAFLAGCGDEGGGGGGAAADAKKKADADAKKKAADAKKKTKKKVKLKEEVASFIPTLERVVPADESKTIRRRLKERDFLADPLGAENRDPFRSFLLPQVGSDEPQAPTTNTARPTDQCAKNKLVATNYALRDLNLIGIVVRGAQRFALFRDAKGIGHMVERGRCVGREKALVTEIGDGHVTIEIMPEAIAGGAEPTAEKKSIPLYPNELTVDDLDESEDTPTDTTTTTPAPAPTVDPPSGAENL